MTTTRILLITNIILLAVAVFLYTQWRKESRESARKDTVISEKTDSLEYTTNKLGQAVAEKDAAVVTASELDDFYKKEITQIKEEMSINKRDIKAFIKAEFQARGEGTTTINNQYYQDSTGVTVSERTFSIADGYLTLDAVLDSTKVKYNYSYSDEILSVFHFDKKWLFGKETLKASSRLKNPNAKVINSTAVTVEEYKDKRFVLAAGVSWLPLNPDIQFWPTISVGYALLKF